MKLKVTITLVFLCIGNQLAKAQVWYPEGVLIPGPPSLIKVENQVIIISKVGADAVNSYWQLALNDGKVWSKMPVLTLNKAAEISDIKQYQGSIYLSGNFTYDNENYNALVRYNLITGKWQGIALFMKAAQFASISTMDVQNAQLVIGGNFYNILYGSQNDTIPNLSRYSAIGGKFSSYFDGICRKCEPDGPVLDIISNDTISAISGSFTNIGNHQSAYLLRIHKGGAFDTFINTPQVMEKLALDGNVIYATSGALKAKHIYKVTKTFTDINYNLDSSLYINEILMYEGQLLAAGAFQLAATGGNKVSIIRLDGGKWVNMTNNYGNAHHIATGRSTLFAIGNPANPVSIWNPNKYVVRFYPGLSLVRARVFLDSNNNCIKEGNENPVPKQYIRLPFLNRGAFTNENGMAEFMVPNAVTNTLKFAIRPLKNHVRSNCADTTVTRTFTPGVYLDSIQFPLVRIPNLNDVRITLSSPKGSQVVKGRRVIYYLTCENIGSNMVDGKVRLQKNSKFTEQKFDPVGTAVDAGTYEWSYTKLAPGQKKTFMYSGLAKDTSFSKDQEFNAAASCSVTSGNSPNTDDDFDSIPQVVNSSSSNAVMPFRKEVYPNPIGNDSITYLTVNDRDLRYNISFNNFSSDTVFYAVIIDTLDLNLDMSYIQETGSNKYYYTEVQTDPNNQYKGILIWHFPNIRLAPNPTMNYEVQESGSYIGFKVVTKPLSDGYMLKNVASVFYDNRYAGSTNAVYCTISLSGIDDLESGGGSMITYPNPFNQELTLQHDFSVGDAVKVYNANGQLVHEAAINADAGSFTIDLKELNAGMYIVQVFSGAKLFHKKCLKL